MRKSLSSAVAISLDGDEYELIPSLKAANAVSRQFEGFAGAFEKIRSLDLDAFIFICRAGIARSSISSDDLAEAVYAAGMPSLIAPVMDFVLRLQNGGRDPNETPEESDDRGNGEV